jgi:acyl carrier protein
MATADLGRRHNAKTTIRDFILASYLPGESPDNLTDHTPLRTSGILDSFATLSLVAFLEKQFGIELDVYETAVERFDRVADIVACVERKTSATTGPDGTGS